MFSYCRGEHLSVTNKPWREKGSWRVGFKRAKSEGETVTSAEERKGRKEKTREERKMREREKKREKERRKIKIEEVVGGRRGERKGKGKRSDQRRNREKKK